MHVVIYIVLIIASIGLVVGIIQAATSKSPILLIISAALIGLILFPVPTIIILLILFAAYIYLIHNIRKTISDALEERKMRRKERKEKRRARREAKLSHSDTTTAALKDIETRNALSENPHQFITEGVNYVKKMEKLNKSISHAQMKKAVQGLMATIADMLQEVLKHPEKATAFHKVTDYYLPTVCKLMERYVECGERQSEREDDQKIQAEIEKSIVELDTALKNLTVSQSYYDDMDTLSELSVMRQIMENDGLKSTLQNSQ